MDSLGRILYMAAGAMLLLALLRIARDLRSRKISLSIHRKKLFVAFGSGLLIASLTFLLVKPDYRVLSDEATLTSISKMMKETGNASTLFMTRYAGSQITPLRIGIDKRPPFFPYIVHTVHWILGYRPSNPFVVNFIVFTLLLTLIHLWIGSAFGFTIALASQFLVAAQPGVFLSATSAGFDLFATLLLALTCAAAWVCVVKGHRGWFGLTLILSGMLVMTRYESILLSVIIVTYLFLRLKPSRQILRQETPWIIAILIVLFPIIWLWMHVLNHPAFFELSPGERLFSFNHLFTHLKDLAVGLFSPPANYPDQRVFHLLCALSVIFLLRRRASIRSSAELLLVLSGLSTLISLAFFFGSFTQPAALRLFLNFLIPWSLLPIIAFGIWIKKSRPGILPELLCALLALIFFFHGALSRSPDEIFANVGATNGYIQAREFLRSVAIERPLIVSKFPTHFAIMDFASIDFETFHLNQERIVRGLSRGEFTKIYVFQDISSETMLPHDDEIVDPANKLNPLQELPISAKNRLRISEIVL